ncbi:hypothetical protein RchiOBHm_Chr1g0381711 [Rosa chinensis]|uniref:Uncharacterized protein n=1 Tax=Rosa chinensis TaxID=74649 RepID=A0A2P6SP68_ROSCH|nr:hypothetical protein RchiOBHm_Chr1g0381711 [Rosa chinensis]
MRKGGGMESVICRFIFDSPFRRTWIYGYHRRSLGVDPEWLLLPEVQFYCTLKLVGDVHSDPTTFFFF